MALIEVDWNPPRRQLRQFAAILILAAPAVGALLHFVKGWISFNAFGIVAALGVVLGATGLVAPPLIRPVFVALMAISLPIGLVVATVLLSVIYFLVILPIGLVLRLFGYDSMKRGEAAAESSYWIRRVEPTEAKRYFRQY